MNNILLSMQSATFSLKAKRLLNRNNINCRLVKLDGYKTQNGCTHGIEISAADFYNAVMILRNSGIEYFVYQSENL